MRASGPQLIGSLFKFRAFTTIEIIGVLALMMLLSVIAIGGFALLGRENDEWNDPIQLAQAAVREARFQSFVTKEPTELVLNESSLIVRTRAGQEIRSFDIPEAWLPWSFYERLPEQGLSGGSGRPALQIARERLPAIRFDPSGVSSPFVLIVGEGQSRERYVFDIVSDAIWEDWQ